MYMRSRMLCCKRHVLKVFEHVFYQISRHLHDLKNVIKFKLNIISDYVNFVFLRTEN